MPCWPSRTNTDQMPGPITGGFPAGVGTPPVTISGVPTAGQVPVAVNGTTATWQAGGGGGGATIPATTNLIKGDGAGNGADSNIDTANVVQTGSAPTLAGLTISGVVFGPDGEGAVKLTGNFNVDGALGAGELDINTGGVFFTALTSSATANRSITLPDADATLVPNIAGFALADGMTATTQGAGDQTTKLATTAYADNSSASAAGLIGVPEVLAVSAITPVADGTYSPVTITVVSGIITAVTP